MKRQTPPRDPNDARQEVLLELSDKLVSDKLPRWPKPAPPCGGQQAAPAWAWRMAFEERHSDDSQPLIGRAARRGASKCKRPRRAVSSCRVRGRDRRRKRTGHDRMQRLGGL